MIRRVQIFINKIRWKATGAAHSPANANHPWWQQQQTNTSTTTTNTTNTTTFTIQQTTAATLIVHSDSNTPSTPNPAETALQQQQQWATTKPNNKLLIKASNTQPLNWMIRISSKDPGLIRLGSSWQSRPNKANLSRRSTRRQPIQQQQQINSSSRPHSWTEAQPTKNRALPKL